MDWAIMGGGQVSWHLRIVDKATPRGWCHVSWGGAMPHGERPTVGQKPERGFGHGNFAERSGRGLLAASEGEARPRNIVKG